VSYSARALGVFVLFAAGACAAAAGSDHSPDVLVLHVGTLLASPGEPPRQHQTVVVTGSRVSEVRDGFVPVEAFGPRAQLIDLSAEFAMPGLSDVHLHLASPEHVTSRSSSSAAARIAELTLQAAGYARRLLRVGITTVRDVGDSSNAITFQLRDAIAAGRIEGPRMFAAGRIISRTEGHGAESRRVLDLVEPVPMGGCDGVESCRHTVRENIGDGHLADLIKFAGSGSVSERWGEKDAQPTSFDDELRAVVDAAGQLGRSVAVHAHSTASINQALRMGALTVEHGTYFDDTSVRLFKEHRAYLVPTSFVGELMTSDPRIRDRNTPEDWQRIQSAAADQLQTCGRAYRAGIALGVGTDGTAGSDPLNTVRELEIFVAKGVPAAEAIKAATVNNAAIVGHSADLGQIRPGFAADIVALPADPLSDIGALRAIDFVMKGGTVIRSEMRPAK
jgi:imidazolonepropionase-like amidohydrolase